MHENRTAYPAKKTRMYQQLQSLPGKYRVMAIVRMEKVRSTQILPLRKILKDNVAFVSVKDKIAQKALGELGVSGIADMTAKLTGQCMFLLTDMSPFRLNILLAKNRIMMAARGGDVASVDVVVPAKNTGIAPGPMLTEFKDAGIPTKIDQGTIWIAKDSTPVLKGGAINEKLASILGKLDIKPIEAGISLYAALDGGSMYSQDDLVVDVAKVQDELVQAYHGAISLSVEASYVTPESAPQILARASQHARSLSVESGFMTDETKHEVLQGAHSHAASLAGQASDYTPG